jgi:hypothetical protein
MIETMDFHDEVKGRLVSSENATINLKKNMLYFTASIS